MWPVPEAKANPSHRIQFITMRQNTSYEMDNVNLLEDTNNNSFRGLSAKEQKLIAILKEIKGEKLVEVSIRIGLSGGELGRVRKVIKMLKDQYQDCGRERMIQVLGVEAVRLLEAL